MNDPDRQILKIFFTNNNNIGLLFLKQVKTGTAYVESSFWQDFDSDSDCAPLAVAAVAAAAMVVVGLVVIIIIIVIII